MFTPRFNSFVNGFILPHETSYKRGHWGDDNFVITEHDPNDAGGATKYGIDQRSYGRDPSGLTKDGAIAIYYKDYWLKYKCESFDYPLGEVIMDISVNSGYGRAKQLYLQAKGDPAKMLEFREDFYKRLAARSEKNATFLKGWLARTEDLYSFLSIKH